MTHMNRSPAISTTATTATAATTTATAESSTTQLVPQVVTTTTTTSNNNTNDNKEGHCYSELKITGPPLYNQIKTTDILPLVTKGPPVDASRTALLVVDVQPEYWSSCPAVRQDFPYFPQHLSSLVDTCRRNRAKLIWVRADYRYEHSPWLAQFARLHQGRIPPEVYTHEQADAEWEDFATPQGGEFVIPKTSWSSTSHTALLDLLRESGIDTVLVCGLITSVCVQHSAFGIFEAGYRTILVTDACADRGRARHDAALALYGDYMYELFTSAQVKEQLTAAKPVWLNAPSSSQPPRTTILSLRKNADQMRSFSASSSQTTTTTSSSSSSSVSLRLEDDEDD